MRRDPYAERLLQGEKMQEHAGLGFLLFGCLCGFCAPHLTRALVTMASRLYVFIPRQSSTLGTATALVLISGMALPTTMFSTPVNSLKAQESSSLGEPETLTDESALPPVSSPSSASTAPEDRQPNSVLSRMLDAGIGWLVLFLLISIVTLSLIIEHSLSIRKGKIMPDFVVSDLDQMISEGKIEDAAEFCRQPENNCLASEVILAGLERHQGSEFGFAEYKTAIEEEGEDQTARLYRKTEVLGVIGAIAPMLGLLGTVSGMIVAFNKIAETSGPAKPDELAGGIGQALITTLLGLLVAIPAMIAFSFFRNKIDSLVAEVGKRVERIMMPLGRKR